MSSEHKIRGETDRPQHKARAKGKEGGREGENHHFNFSICSEATPETTGAETVMRTSGHPAKGAEVVFVLEKPNINGMRGRAMAMAMSRFAQEGGRKEDELSGRGKRERDYHQPCVHCTSHYSCNSSLISLRAHGGGVDFDY